MFGGIALPGRKLGCLVLEIYNRVSLFIISNSILIKCQRINGVKVRLDGRILRLVVGDDLFRGHGIVGEQGIYEEKLNLCRVYAHTVRIGDLEVDAMESAGSAACVDLHARHYAGDIAEIGGTGAPAVVVEDNFFLRKVPRSSPQPAS